MWLRSGDCARGGFPMHGNGRVYQTHFGNMYHRRRNPANHENAQNTQTQWSTLIQMLPLAVFLVLTMMNGSQDSPPFSLAQGRGYRVQMQTNNRNIPFFVPDESAFRKNYPDRSYARRELEREVWPPTQPTYFWVCQMLCICRLWAFLNQFHANGYQYLHCR